MKRNNAVRDSTLSDFVLGDEMTHAINQGNDARGAAVAPQQNNGRLFQ